MNEPYQRMQPKVRRNQLCPCGQAPRKKFKKCCGDPVKIQAAELEALHRQAAAAELDARANPKNEVKQVLAFAAAVAAFGGTGGKIK